MHLPPFLLESPFDYSYHFFQAAGFYVEERTGIKIYAVRDNEILHFIIYPHASIGKNVFFRITPEQLRYVNQDDFVERLVTKMFQ